jgi:hypothetical protein
MRRVLLTDILAASTLIAAAPKSHWGSLSQQIIAQTEAAYRYFKRFKRAHPLWGDGSLAARTGGQVCVRHQDLNAPHDLEALGWFLSVLAAHKMTPK